MSYSFSYRNWQNTDVNLFHHHPNTKHDELYVAFENYFNGILLEVLWWFFYLWGYRKISNHFKCITIICITSYLKCHISSCRSLCKSSTFQYADGLHLLYAIFHEHNIMQSQPTLHKMTYTYDVHSIFIKYHVIVAVDSWPKASLVVTWHNYDVPNFWVNVTNNFIVDMQIWSR